VDFYAPRSLPGEPITVGLSLSLIGSGDGFISTSDIERPASGADVPRPVASRGFNLNCGIAKRACGFHLAFQAISQRLSRSGDTESPTKILSKAHASDRALGYVERGAGPRVTAGGAVGRSPCPAGGSKEPGGTEAPILLRRGLLGRLGGGFRTADGFCNSQRKPRFDQLTDGLRFDRGSRTCTHARARPSPSSADDLLTGKIVSALNV
jgi:hypothetical protein